MIIMKDYEKRTQKLYNRIENIWPNNNKWYDYTQNQINRFIIENKHKLNHNSMILNAGSGGSEYKIPGIFFHVDLVEKSILKYPHHFVSSIEKMPFKESTFDFAICVGSVINYCNALTALDEIYRVCKANSYFILEYERSSTGELLWNKERRKSVTLQIYNYNGQSNHKLWLYSDNYINNILCEVGFKILNERYFHSLSSIYNKFVKDENISGKIGPFDRYLSFKLKRCFAHNRILICQK